MRKLFTYIGAILAMAVPYGVAVAAAPAKSDPGSGKTIVANVNDPGDGGGAYPLWTGICRLTGGQYNEGFYYVWPGNQRRDKCNSGWYTVEIWNGSSWQVAAYYD